MFSTNDLEKRKKSELSSMGASGETDKADIRANTSLLRVENKAFSKFLSDPVGSCRNAWGHVKEEAIHYWIGSKLLWKEIKLAKSIIVRALEGHAMTRRERLQLTRTTMDIFRLVPFAIFVLVPFMEFLLPVALKLFPNMLPSTFQAKLKKEENMKKELTIRLEIASFLQGTLLEMAKKKKKGSSDSDSANATEVLDFMENGKMGKPLPNSQVIKMASLFEDELTLANISRPQLIQMCLYMGTKPFGGDGMLRFQLRNKMRAIKEDDRRILWEGVDSLTFNELQDACRERGMRAYGMTETHCQKQIREWLDLSIQKNTPISLLIMSRAFSLTTSTFEDNAEKISKTISTLDEDVINEVVLSASHDEEDNTVSMKMRRLESLEHQEELIDDEREEVEEAKARSEETNSSSACDEEDWRARSVEGVRTSGVLKDPSLNVNQESSAELTLAEIETLGDLARGSSVEKEKQMLNIIKSKFMMDGGTHDEEGEQQKQEVSKSEQIVTTNDTILHESESLREEYTSGGDGKKYFMKLCTSF